MAPGLTWRSDHPRPWGWAARSGAPVIAEVPCGRIRGSLSLPGVYRRRAASTDASGRPRASAPPVRTAPAHRGADPPSAAGRERDASDFPETRCLRHFYFAGAKTPEPARRRGGPVPRLAGGGGGPVGGGARG